MFQRREALMTFRLKFYDELISNDLLCLMCGGFGKDINHRNPDNDKANADQGR